MYLKVALSIATLTAGVYVAKFPLSLIQFNQIVNNPYCNKQKRKEFEKIFLFSSGLFSTTIYILISWFMVIFYIIEIFS